MLLILQNPMIYVILFIQSLVASGTHIVAKVIVADIEPVTLTMMRSLLAAIVLVGAVAVRKQNLSFTKGDYKPLLLLSFLAIPVNQFLFLSAIKLTTPANASLLYGTTPAAVLLISWLTGKETITGKKGAGIAIAFLGILIVVFERGVDFRSEYTVGNALLCIAVIAWALYTILGRPLIQKYGAFQASAVTMIVGTILFVPIGIGGTVEYDYSTLTMAHWGGLLYLSLGTSILAYFLWYYALGKIEASKVAIFANVQPVLTTILSVILLGQTITAAFLIGGSIALLGVVLTQFG